MNFQMKFSYKTQKQMKKLYGQKLGRDIAIGRILTKIIKEEYQPERLSEKTYYRNEDGTYPHLEPVIGSDSLNQANK
jgi:hypothetical protein